MISRAANAPDRLDDLRHGGCHVPQRARKHAHLVAGLVHLDARAIELQLERRLTERLEARPPRLSAGDASIGSTGRNSWIAYLDRADAPFDKRRARDAAKIAAHHRRLPNSRRRERRRLWPRLRRARLPARPDAARPTAGARESPVRCSVARLKRSVDCCARERVAPAPPTLAIRSNDVVNLSQLERRLRRRRLPLAPARRADQPMPMRPCGSEPDRYATAMGISSGRSLFSSSASLPILSRRASRTRDRIRHVDQLLQPHPSMLRRRRGRSL